MKGLLLKDWYSIKSNLRSFLLLDLVFIIAAGFSEGNNFLLYYPCISSGIIATSLISYEEREKWNVYAQTLPYTRTQMVTAKYLISLIIGTVTVMGILLAQTAAMLASGELILGALTQLLTALVPFTLLPSALMLPFIFKFGAEKGRMAYYIVIGGFCAALGIIAGLDMPAMQSEVASLLMVAGSALPFAGSWLLSIRLYQNREI